MRPKRSRPRVMVWAVLILLGVVVIVHWLEYRRSVQKYTFAQPATLVETRDVVGEKTPIVVEIGTLPWRPEIASQSQWIISVGEEGQMDMPSSQWIAESPRPSIQNPEKLAQEIEIETGLTEIDDGKQWWWMSGLVNTTVGVLDKDSVRPLEWVTAERKWFGCTSGQSLLIWLVHPRYRKYLPDTAKQSDPWKLTTAETPWLGRVQYIEVLIKPGWCIGVPAHWGFAARCVETGCDGSSPIDSWWWETSQHSPLSLALTRLQS